MGSGLAPDFRKRAPPGHSPQEFEPLGTVPLRHLASAAIGWHRFLGVAAGGPTLRRFWLSGAVIAIVLAGLLPEARAAATEWVGDNHAAARLITATDATGSGKTVEAGLEIRLAPGWHAYWRTPGDAGIPPSIDWSGSENLTRAEIAWPAPARYSLQGFETAGYRDHIVLPITATLRQPGNPLDLHALVSWAACANICVPYSTKLDLRLPAGPAAPVAGGGADRRSPRRVFRNRRPSAGVELVAANVAARGADAALISPAAQQGHTLQNTRPVCRRAGQGIARPAGCSAVAGATHGAAHRTDPRCGLPPALPANG